ncbi:MAG: IS1595 family transposase [Candidatus Sericytochromatia bacterium]|nr:IS1595 family transposase [Candidatus Tanganyikabacteria bacterium]
MDEYSLTLIELEERFSTEEACREYLFRLRWPEGFVCPRCAGPKAWPSQRGLWLCADCSYQASVTAGTIFQDTRTPLTLWFRAIWWVTCQKYGANALGIQRILGLGSYRTAWTWLHKLRRAMIRPGRDRLNGEVEVDETFVGGREEGVAGRETETKTLVAIAVEMRERGLGRVRMRSIPDGSANSLAAFIEETIEPGSTIRTDGWKGYGGMDGYTHEPRPIKGSGLKAHEMMPGVHRVAALLKRWLLGTYQGAVSSAHLDYYLDEFTFRFNRRASRHRGKLFHRLLEQAVAVEPVTYEAMVKGIRGKPRAKRRKRRSHARLAAT